MLEDAGGFGKLQLLITLTWILSDNGVYSIIAGLANLTKVPGEYFCTRSSHPGVLVACKPEDFCDDVAIVSFEPNMSLPDSYDNWIQRFDLTCASGTKIGFIGSSFFTGWVVTLLIVPRISDFYGR